MKKTESEMTNVELYLQGDWQKAGTVRSRAIELPSHIRETLGRRMFHELTISDRRSGKGKEFRSDYLPFPQEWHRSWITLTPEAREDYRRAAECVVGDVMSYIELARVLTGNSDVAMGLEEIANAIDGGVESL